MHFVLVLRKSVRGNRMTSQQGPWMVRSLVKQGSALTNILIILAFTVTLTGASVMLELYLRVLEVTDHNEMIHVHFMKTSSVRYVVKPNVVHLKKRTKSLSSIQEKSYPPKIQIREIA